MDSSASDDIEMEMEYLPHWWSTKFETPDEVMQQFIQFITADAPIVLYVYGGNWMEISKEVSRFPAISLHKAGVKTIIVGYDQGTDVTMWDIVEQTDDAVVYAMKYATEKKSRGLYLVGHGSGAHLIAQVLSDFELCDRQSMEIVNGVFLISGLYDLTEFSYTSANDTIKISRMDEISFSPLYHIYYHLEHSTTRFYILIAEEDSSTYKSQGRDLYEILVDICPTQNMYFEEKSNMDHYDMVKCLTNEDNYLIQLILQDLQKHGR